MRFGGYSGEAGWQPWSSEKRGSQPLLDVRDLHVHYVNGHAPVRAVNGVSFSIRRGEVLGLAGESGCGKSTIAHAILRVLRPPAVIAGGEVLYQGQDVLDMELPDLERLRWNEISIVFQSAMNALNPVMTIGDQIADVVQRHKGATKKEALDRAAEMLNMVGIDGQRLKDYPHQLSGGMRQRAVIAIALALDPQMVILDEPTTALDVVVQKDILQEIERLKEQMGLSILFITHDLSLLVQFANRIAIMYAGEIVEIAKAQDLFDDARHPYTRGLMSSFPSIFGEKRKLAGIPGAPPDLRRLPTGCPFHPRCPMIAPACKEIKPHLRQVVWGRLAACHFADSQEWKQR